MTTAPKVTLSPADSPYVSIFVMENYISQVWLSSLTANHSPKLWKSQKRSPIVPQSSSGRMVRSPIARALGSTTSMKRLHLAAIFAGCVGIASAQQANRQQVPQTSFEVEVEIPEIISLWEGHAPGALGDEDRDKPTLTIYLPRSSTSNGTAIVVAPGGGYGHLDSNHEGRQVANWLNALGITAFVLKYRLGPRYHHPIELGDAQRALRLVRSRAQEFRIRPNRVGMMGFSAGGHLASTAATHFDAGDPAAADPVDRVSCRPDFLVLGYPVISFTAPYTHQGSVTNLLERILTPSCAKSFRMNSRLSRRLLQRFCLPPAGIRKCWRRTASHSIWPCIKPECLPRCIFSRVARIVLA
jgi:hypothetical protein